MTQIKEVSEEPRPLHPAFAVGAAVVLIILAFPASVADLARLALSPVPESLSAGVIVVSAVWAWIVLSAPGLGGSGEGTSKGPSGDGPPHGAAMGGPPREGSRARRLPVNLRGLRDHRVIGLGVLALVAIAAWLWPVDELTDLRRSRPGLILLPPFAAALALVAGGREGLRRCAGPVALLAVAWPPLAAALAAPLTPPMLTLARGAGSALARIAGVDVRAVPEAGRILLCTGRAGTHAVAVESPCSGVTSVLAVLVVAAPVLHAASGAAVRKAAWVAGGCLLVAILVPVRVGLLCFIAAQYGAASAFRAFHVVGGMAFFVVVWAAMLALTRLARLAPPRLVRSPGAKRLPEGRAGWGLFASTVVLAASAGLGDVRMNTRARLPRPSGDTVTVERARPNLWLPDVPGHRRWHFRSLPWTQAMYGPDSRMERFIYAPAEGSYFWVDVLLAPEFTLLEQHTALGCFRWHGYTVRKAEAFTLVEGVPARRFVYIDNDGRRWASVTWIERAQADGSGWWRRVTPMRRVYAGADEAALAAVTEFARLLARPGSGPPRTPGPEPHRPTVRNGQTREDKEGAERKEGPGDKKPQKPKKESPEDEPDWVPVF